MRVWISAHKQRLVYVLVAVAMTVAVGAGVVGGFMLHHAADLERQTLRTQGLAGAVFRLQNFTLQAQEPGGATAALAAQRARRAAAAEAALALVRRHDAGEAARLEPAYRAYLQASDAFFDQARAGGVPAADQRLLQQRIGAFAARVDAEVNRKGREVRKANPETRLVLIVAAVAILALIAALVWQFELERRAGRIDRDNARRTADLMRLREEFVAGVSHELRTPLTSIMGYLDLIQESERTGRPVDDQHALLGVVQRNAERLLRLVNDLLFVAEVEGGAMTLDVREVDVSKLAADCIEAAAPSADAKGVELALAGGVPAASVEGDGLRLAQMMDNLVSNAIKFTPEGGRVTVTAGADDSAVLIAVADSGIGISADDQLQLFERFFRARSASVQVAPGTGLGLTITKAIVEAHRGSIDVESSPGVGTTFRVRLPRRRR